MKFILNNAKSIIFYFYILWILVYRYNTWGQFIFFTSAEISQSFLILYAFIYILFFIYIFPLKKLNKTALFLVSYAMIILIMLRNFSKCVSERTFRFERVLMQFTNSTYKLYVQVPFAD